MCLVHLYSSLGHTSIEKGERKEAASERVSEIVERTVKANVEQT